MRIPRFFSLLTALLPGSLPAASRQPPGSFPAASRQEFIFLLTSHFSLYSSLVTSHFSLSSSILTSHFPRSFFLLIHILRQFSVCHRWDVQHGVARRWVWRQEATS